MDRRKFVTSTGLTISMVGVSGCIGDIGGIVGGGGNAICSVPSSDTDPSEFIPDAPNGWTQKSSEAIPDADMFGVDAGHNGVYSDSDGRENGIYALRFPSEEKLNEFDEGMPNYDAQIVLGMFIIGTNGERAVELLKASPLISAGCVDKRADIGGGNSSAAATTETTETPTPEPNECEIENSTASVSPVVVRARNASPSSPDSSLNVKWNARTQDSIDKDPDDMMYSPSESDTKHVVIRMNIENAGDEAVPLPPDLLRFEYETPNTTGDGQGYIGGGIPDVDLKPGGSISAWDYFEVPNEATKGTVTASGASEDLTLAVQFACESGLAIDIPEGEE